MVKFCAKIFVAVPLGIDDSSGKFIIPEYDKDVTHITARSFDWWKNLFLECSYKVEYSSHEFMGMKENWTTVFPNGNAFFLLSNNSL